MTANWIGTRTAQDRVFAPSGLGHADCGSAAFETLLPSGSLLVEAETRPSLRPTNLLRYRAMEPWPTGLTICLEPDGTVRLLMRQGSRQLETALKTGLGREVQTAHITYVWDAPARSGLLSVHDPDRGLMWQTSVMSPFPLTMDDARRIITAPHICHVDKDVIFVALADGPCAVGPMPGLSQDAVIETLNGPVVVRDLAPGDRVVVDGRRPAEVLGIVQAKLPCVGRFAPMTLRQPYMGLWDDLVTTRDQRVCLAGSEVEYLFGEERVTTAIRHLEIRNCATPTKPCPAVMTYYQVLLATHEIMTVNGASVESFDASAVLSRPDWVPASVLRDVDLDRTPYRVGLAAPVLLGYEALTLTGASIG